MESTNDPDTEHIDEESTNKESMYKNIFNTKTIVILLILAAVAYFIFIYNAEQQAGPIVKQLGGNLFGLENMTTTNISPFSSTLGTIRE